MSNSKEKVSIIGLGLMGAELARVLVRNGYRITVWNRTAAKGKALVNEGAALADNVANAIEASPIVIVCVDDYKVSRSILASDDVAPLLSGKLIIEFSTGTPEDAREAGAWLRERGAEYLDGAIMATPSQVGRPDTTILTSGAISASKKSEAVLKTLAGNLTYTGESVGNASALDLALLSYWFGGVFGFLHGVRICESENLPVDLYGSMVEALTSVIGEQNRKMAGLIQADRHDHPDASIKTCAAAAQLFVRQAKETGINSEFPDFASRIFNHAMYAGLGDEGLSAVIKVLRNQIGAEAASH
jgi:3-hydroxyisobutyrate dehydrogenase-like beta-hydroxyacid dehydrogenase